MQGNAQRELDSDSIAIVCMVNNLSRVASQLALVFHRHM